jgi:hypothetical protein
MGKSKCRRGHREGELTKREKQELGLTHPSNEVLEMAGRKTGAMRDRRERRPKDFRNSWKAEEQF